MYKIKNISHSASAEDGSRYLVEVFWPEGKSSIELYPYQWLKDLSPSYDLLEKSKLEKWTDEVFHEQYLAELKKNEAFKKPTIDEVARQGARGTVTFLYASERPAASYAATLKSYFTARKN